MKTHKQVALIVLDGWGYREDSKDNAVAAAHTPNFKKYWDMYPHSLLQASGLAVGLPEGQMGNSEVGHMTIGAGKPLDQDLVRIQKSIDTGEYESNPAFTALFKHVKDNNSVLHALGLVSNGGVHSHQEHLFAFLRAAHKAGVKKVAIHVFTDGRDSAPQSAGDFMKKLETVLDEVGNAFVASISGRFYAMDRDNNWDRLKKTEEALFECKGNVCTIKPSAYLEDLYKQNLGNKSLDEHIEPIVCTDLNGENCAIKDNDAVFFFNFRSDRARMLSEKLIEKENSHNICFATLTEYSAEFKCLVAFPPIKIDTTLAKEVSDAGMTQAHIAETEKFPHATYFLNGGFEGEYPGETHILLDSRKDVQTHDLAPKMRAEAITDKTIEQISAGTNFIFVNFANADMVGHTANVPAIIEAVEEVDTQLGRVVEAMNAVGGAVFFTADHGNAEINIDPVTGEKHTSHTINPVPAVLTDVELKIHDGTLADIAPTILTVLGLKVPDSMTGKSLAEVRD